MFHWWKKRRRRKLRTRPFPDEWESLLRKNVWQFSQLDEVEKAKLRDDVKILIAEKNWEGCGGLKMTDEIRVAIAGQAALLTLGFDEMYFDRVLSILVYPDAYFAPTRETRPGGVVIEGRCARSGEAWLGGPVILSWADALAGGRGESGGGNVVIHEFAHQLDMLDDGAVDGTPPLGSAEQYQRWREIMSGEYKKLRQARRRHRRSLLDYYGATNEAEFFAVATECFFERPRRMAREMPELYQLLREFYRQDPALSFEQMASWSDVDRFEAINEE